MTPIIKGALRRQYRIYPPEMEESLTEGARGAGPVERELQNDPSRYLVGSSLTLADITAASLLSPIARVEGSPYEPQGEHAATQGDRTDGG